MDGEDGTGRKEGGNSELGVTSIYLYKLHPFLMNLFFFFFFLLSFRFHVVEGLCVCVFGVFVCKVAMCMYYS